MTKTISTTWPTNYTPSLYTSTIHKPIWNHKTSMNNKPIWTASNHKSSWPISRNTNYQSVLAIMLAKAGFKPHQHDNKSTTQTTLHNPTRTTTQSKSTRPTKLATISHHKFKNLKISKRKLNLPNTANTKISRNKLFKAFFFLKLYLTF